MGPHGLNPLARSRDHAIQVQVSARRNSIDALTNHRAEGVMAYLYPRFRTDPACGPGLFGEHVLFGVYVTCVDKICTRVPRHLADYGSCAAHGDNMAIAMLALAVHSIVSTDSGAVR